jgi:hypothetical protein
MAATLRLDPVQPSARLLAVKGDASYPAGGYPVSASFFDSPGITPVGLNTGTIIGRYDAANKKVEFVTAATGAVVATSSDQSAVTVKVLLYP